MIELEDRLPHSCNFFIRLASGDMDESYKDDMIGRDALVTDTPGQIMAGLFSQNLV